MNAIEFINETKLENMPTEETIKPQLTEEQMRSNRSRTVLKWVVIGIALACSSLFILILYRLYQLVA